MLDGVEVIGKHLFTFAWKIVSELQVQEGFPLLSNVSSNVFSQIQVGLVGLSGESAHFPALLHDTSLHGGDTVGDSEGTSDGESEG